MRKPERDIEQPVLEWPGEKELINAQRALIAAVLDESSVSFYQRISLNTERPSEPVLYYAFRKMGQTHFDWKNLGERSQSRPPFNAEYILYLLLRKEERDVVIGDLI